MIALMTGNKKNGRHGILDYHQKRLENPFYSRKKKISHFGGLRTKLIFLAVFIFVVGLSWFIFASSYWHIKEVSINGLDRMSNDEILKLTNEQLKGRNWLIFPQNNLLFFDQSKFLSVAGELYRFQEIKINKDWPNKLVIEVKEKSLASIWNEGDRYYMIDSEGFVLADVNPLDLTDKTHPLISNESTSKIEDGRIQVDTAYIGAAIELFTKMNQKASSEIGIERFIVDNDINTIKMVTTDGVRVSFSTMEGLDRQVEKLLIIKREKLKEDFKDKKYIDLRFGDKVYFQ